MDKIKSKLQETGCEEIFYDLSVYKNEFSRYDTAASVLLYKNQKNGKKPVVSFVIPAYKRVDGLIEALDSIDRNAPKWPYEIVVVDDAGNIDEVKNTSLLEVKKKDYQNILYYANEKNIGMAGNWNRCVQLSSGKYIAMLHDDDLLTPEYFKELPKLVRAADKHAAKGGWAAIKIKFCSFSDIRKLPERRCIMRGGLKKANRLMTLTSGIGPTNTPSCGMLFRKDALADAGGFYEKLYPSLDHVLGYQLQKKGYCIYSSEDELGLYRVADNVSLRKETILETNRCDTIFREYVYLENFLFKIWGAVFRQAQYSYRIDIMMARAREFHCLDAGFGELDFCKSYKRKNIRYFLYKVIRKFVIDCSSVRTYK